MFDDNDAAQRGIVENELNSLITEKPNITLREIIKTYFADKKKEATENRDLYKNTIKETIAETREGLFSLND